MPNAASADTVPPGGDPSKQPGFFSRTLPIILGRLEPMPDARLLDLGPVCSENINFLALKVRRLYVCDLFLRLSRLLTAEEEPAGLAQSLDYLPSIFDGALLWDLLDRLPTQACEPLVEALARMIRPGGCLWVLALGRAARQWPVHSYLLSDDFGLTVRTQGHLSLGCQHRHSREVSQLMAPFRLLRSHVARNGTREFLFQRP